MSCKNLFGVLGMTLVLSGCIHEPVGVSFMGVSPGTTPPPPPPPAAQVASCTSTRTWHNLWVLSGTVFGGIAGGSGAIDTVTQDHNVQIGLGIGVLAAGVIAAVSSGAAGIEADTYSVDNCAAILQAQANSTFSGAAHP